MVLEVASEVVDPPQGKIGIAVGVKLPDCFFRLPTGGHVPIGITGTQPAELLVPLQVKAE